MKRKTGIEKPRLHILDKIKSFEEKKAGLGSPRIKKIKSRNNIIPANAAERSAPKDPDNKTGIQGLTVYPIFRSFI